MRGNRNGTIAGFHIAMSQDKPTRFAHRVFDTVEEFFVLLASALRVEFLDP